MREDLEREAAEEEGMQRLYEELGPRWVEDNAQELFEANYLEAVKQFKEERLVTYFVAHPDVATPAFVALAEARAMMAGKQARAAVIFAYMAIELTVKAAFLQPLVYGLIHNDALAAFIVELSVGNRRGVSTLSKLLTGVLNEFAEINFRTFKRAGSKDDLMKEIAEVGEARNKIVHQGDTTYDGFAPLTI